ncbi:MAG: thiamine pyrophosphate-binding protein [Acidimicrobiales bacterium]
MPGRFMEGSEAIAEAMVTAGCRFFAGYPMTPFTEVLEHMARLLPAVGGTCINAESELEAIGMAWGAAATGARAATGSVGQGLSLMQESISELCRAQVPLVVVNMSRGQTDYYQSTRGGGHGDYRTPVLAPVDLPEAVELAQYAFHLADEWRNPVLFYGDYYLAHVQESADVRALEFGPLPAKDWVVDGLSGGTGNAKLVSPLSATKHHEDRSGYGGHLKFVAERMATMTEGIEPMVEVGFVDDADFVVVSFGTAARYVRYVVGLLREEGLPIGFVRPITLWPFPSEAIARVAERARALAVYELNNGQMIDDVRLAVYGRAPVEFIGDLTLDMSGFGISPDYDVERLLVRIRNAFTAQMSEVS